MNLLCVVDLASGFVTVTWMLVVLYVNHLVGFLTSISLFLCDSYIHLDPQIFWSDSGELVCIATEESFFILRYMADKVAASQENNEGVTEDGIEDAFEVSVRIWMYVHSFLLVCLIQ